MPLTAIGEDEASQLDMNGHHRSSCIFAGTKLLHGSNENGNDEDASYFDSLPTLPQQILRSNGKLPALFLTLSSGYYSSRGQIIQSLIESKADIGAVSSRESQLDQMRLIGVLSLVAFGACSYLMIDTATEARSCSIFKRIVQVRVMCARLCCLFMYGKQSSYRFYSAQELPAHRCHQSCPSRYRLQLVNVR